MSEHLFKTFTGKFAHLNVLSIRSFDSMFLRSFHTPSRYDFRSNVIHPMMGCQIWAYSVISVAPLNDVKSTLDS